MANDERRARVKTLIGQGEPTEPIIECMFSAVELPHIVALV